MTFLCDVCCLWDVCCCFCDVCCCLLFFDVCCLCDVCCCFCDVCYCFHDVYVVFFDVCCVTFHVGSYLIFFVFLMKQNLNYNKINFFHIDHTTQYRVVLY